MACNLKQVPTWVNWFFLDLICFLKFLWSRTLCLLYKITCWSCVANIGGLALKCLAPWILEEYRPKANIWLKRDITQDWILHFASCIFEWVVPYYLSLKSSQPNPVLPTSKTLLILPHTCPFYSSWKTGRSGRSIRWVHPGHSGWAGHSGVSTPEYPAGLFSRVFLGAVFLLCEHLYLLGKPFYILSF